MSGRIEDRLKTLKVLSEIEPPPELETRTMFAMARAAEAQDTGYSPRAFAQAAGWVVAIGAGVLLSVWLLDDRAPDGSNRLADTATTLATADGLAADAADAATTATAADATGDVTDAAAEAPEPIDEFYALLVAESMRLEELLALIPAPRSVMRADTASTIVGLEDRVASIDAALSGTGAAANLSDFRTVLMLDRVEVMNALVNVRYAQSRAFVF